MTSSEIIITRIDALNLLAQAVQERGAGFEYRHTTKIMVQGDYPGPMSGCWYELNGAPSCGVGVALHKAGVPLTTLDALDQVLDSTDIESVEPVLEAHGVTLTADALEVFREFQRNQDFGLSWGECLIDATKTTD